MSITKADTKNIKILAVDDDLLMRKVLEDIFKKDYIFYISPNAHDFFEKINLYKPDVLLIDVILPDGNGIDICRKLRTDKEFDKTYILMLTSFEDAKSIESAYSAGANDYIRKPFIPYEIISKVNHISKTIEYQNGVENLYRQQKVFSKRLVQINELISEHLNKADKSSLIDSFFTVAEIIKCDFCELVIFPGEKVDIRKKSYSADFKPAGYTYLAAKVDFFQSTDQSVSSFSIKKKDGNSVYAIAGNFFYNKNHCGHVVFQKNSKFSEDTKQLIHLYLDFVNLTGIEIESRKHLYDEVKKERKELNKVRSLQVLLLPDFKEIERYDIASTFIPMEDISGDFFDAFYASENQYIIVLCDVAGHGIASSYIGSSIRGLIRSVNFSNMDPKDVVKVLNDLVVKNLSVTYYFSSLVICSLDLTTDDFTIVSAGHPPCFYYNNRNGQYEMIDKTGPLLGLIGGAEFSEKKINIGDGDCVFLYTDGITEAHMSESNELYGEDRLYTLFQENADKPSIEIVHSIIGSVYEYTGYESMNDDITAICIKKKKKE